MFFFKDKLGRRHIFFDEIGDCSNSQEECACNDLTFSQDNINVNEGSIDIINLKPDNAKSPVAYYIIGDDANLVTVDGDMLKFINPPDYERPFDKDKNNVLNITFIAIDADSKALVRDLQIHILNIDDTASVDNPQEYDEVYQVDFLEYESGYFRLEANSGYYVINNTNKDINTSQGLLQKNSYKEFSTASTIGDNRFIDITEDKAVVTIDDSQNINLNAIINSGSISFVSNRQLDVYNSSGDLVFDNATNFTVSAFANIKDFEYQEYPTMNYIDMSDKKLEVDIATIDSQLGLKFTPDASEITINSNDAVDIYDNKNNKIADNVTTFTSQAIFTAIKD